MIICIRTDIPEANILLLDSYKAVVDLKWYAHRELAITIHHKIVEALDSAHCQFSQISGVVVHSGPGSFTGLRIGVAVANALGYSLGVPVTAMTDQEWLSHASGTLAVASRGVWAVPIYDQPAITSTPRK